MGRGCRRLLRPASSSRWQLVHPGPLTAPEGQAEACHHTVTDSQDAAPAPHGGLPTTPSGFEETWL